MSSDRDVKRIVRSWLEEGVTTLPERVLDDVLDQLPSTPQRRAWWPVRRPPSMSRIVGVGLAAAAVLLVAVLGIQALGGSNLGGPRPLEQQSPGPTLGASEQVESPSPTLHPNFARSLAARGVHDGPLDPGDHTYYEVDGTLLNVMFTVPAGWEWNGWNLSKIGLEPSQSAVISFSAGDVQVYTDPCRWVGAEPDPPTGPLADDLVTALAAQPMRNATTPTGRMAAGLGGPDAYEGAAVELTVPEGIDFSACDGGQFRSWGPEQNARYHQGPGQRDLVWAVDLGLEGPPGSAQPARLVIDAASFPGTPAEVMSELDAILDSIVTGHWG